MRHDYHDRVGLEIARQVAAGLLSHPEWLALARDNLSRWSVTNQDSPALLRAYSEWRSLLERPVGEICSLLVAMTDEGQRLRQSSPFAGVLSPAAVWDIKRRIRDEKIPA